jgi:hypothetical protein
MEKRAEVVWEIVIDFEQFMAKRGKIPTIAGLAALLKSGHEARRLAGLLSRGSEPAAE